MENKMILLFVVGILIGAVGVYGAAMTGYVPVTVEEAEAKAAGVAYGRSLQVQILNEAKDAVRDLKALGYEGVTVIPMTEVAVNEDGIPYTFLALAVVRIC